MFLELLSPYIRLTKSELRVGLYAWATFIGMIAGLKTLPSLALMLKSLIAIFTIALAVYIYNDLNDIKLDKISAEAGDHHYINRPLVLENASKLNAKIFIIFLVFFSLGIGVFINYQFLFLLVMYLVLGIFYSTPPIHLKNRFLFKQLTISAGQGISSLAGGAAIGVISNPVIYTALLFFILAFGVVPVTDIRDIYGDEKMGRKTLPIVIGPKSTIKFAIIIVVATLSISLLFYSWIGFNSIFAILLVISFSMLLLSIYNIGKNINNPNSIEILIKKTLRPIFIILQLSILIGLIQF